MIIAKILASISLISLMLMILCAGNEYLMSIFLLTSCSSFLGLCLNFIWGL